jgi:hypothetical protein
VQDRPIVVRPSLWTSGLIVFCDLFLLLNGIAFPFVIHSQGVYDLLMGMFFISLPGVVFGSLVFTQGWLRFRTSLTFDQHGMSIAIPTTRASGCFFPLRRCQLKWNDIHRITSIECLYQIVIPIPVRQYTLSAARQRYTLAPAFCPHLAAVVRTIAERAGVPIEDLGTEPRSLFRQREEP